MRGGKVPKTVDEYLAKVPEPARSTLTHIRKDSLRGSTRNNRSDQLWDPDVQVQRNAHRVRRFLQALQPFSYRLRRDREVQERTCWLQNFPRNHSVPFRQVLPRRVAEEDRKGQSERKQRVGLSRIPSRLPSRHCYTVFHAGRVAGENLPFGRKAREKYSRWNRQHGCFDVADLYHRD